MQNLKEQLKDKREKAKEFIDKQQACSEKMHKQMKQQENRAMEQWRSSLDRSGRNAEIISSQARSQRNQSIKLNGSMSSLQPLSPQENKKISSQL